MISLFYVACDPLYQAPGTNGKSDPEPDRDRASYQTVANITVC
ncbi:hypothetical protein [Microcoleus sp. K5-D4]